MYAKLLSSCLRLVWKLLAQEYITNTPQLFTKRLILKPGNGLLERKLILNQTLSVGNLFINKYSKSL